MASLLERMNISSDSLTGPVRHKSNSQKSASAPYNRSKRTPKGDVDGAWSHDLYESHNSLSARLNLAPTAPKASLNPLAQKALKDAITPTGSGTGLSIKGASGQGNVVEVSGLLPGTTPDDVAAIFKRCGQITEQKLSSKTKDDVRIRLTFKTPASAQTAIQKFNNQPADGKILSVKVVGNSGVSLAGRLGGGDGLGLVREEGSVDVLMGSSDDTGSKLRSDMLISDPRAQVMVAPPGLDPSEYVPSSSGGRGRGGRRGGRGGRRGRRGGHNGARMDTD
ncbi:hypothetical protein CVT24_007295 [Panaeolus cyanescens]|uniref:RRM domain-containing protein n=1 Tax=Panaeolus cyanescens TaxID=181874 RepID=A0A409VJ40_9AGAR|nr:hypothetical protein CVT24_007295 [Panaeolus cyanescens]